MTKPGELPPGQQPQKVAKTAEKPPGRYRPKRMDRGLQKVTREEKKELRRKGKLIFIEDYKPHAYASDEGDRAFLYMSLAMENKAKEAAERRARRVTKRVAEMQKLMAATYKILKKAIGAEDWNLVNEALYIKPVVTREEVAEAKAELEETQ